ncbi:hypothetical protein [Methanobrevibacter sp. DSM 116169]|uniref:hypothetical protein n=1 Tax=Methanobrevibacter sp. DSM 116169 TaxID=3242727 RepID=UPI0038FC2D6E
MFDDKFDFIDIEINEISYSLDESNSVIIKSFAQDDVIKTFLTSIDEGTELEIISYIDDMISSYLDNLELLINKNNKINGKAEQQVFIEIDKMRMNNRLLIGNFRKSIINIKQENLNPIISSIKSLPIEELSNLCESLIHITSLKRKIDNTIESVGGDVDVAIITKSYGFIWTKRKHYFDLKLNYHFFKENQKI